MLSNRLAVAALAIACIVAAGAGGYLATRQNATTPVSVAASSPATTMTTPAERPVQETEALIGDAAPRPAPPVTASVPAAASKRGETTPRAAARSAKSVPAASQNPPP